LASSDSIDRSRETFSSNARERIEISEKLEDAKRASSFPYQGGERQNGGRVKLKLALAIRATSVHKQNSRFSS